MTRTGLAKFADEHLSSIRHKSGQLLYSGADTLRPGKVYLLGHNPGGSPDNRSLPTIQQSLNSLATESTNSYLDTNWSGRDVLQRRVIWLLAGLGLHPRNVAASNLCFVRSRDAESSDFWKYADLCWPVHEEILKIVKPRLVIVYGNSGSSPYGFLSKQLGAGRHQTVSAGHGNWKCRTFKADRYRVVGLPHLGRYDITSHCNVVQWIRSFE